MVTKINGPKNNSKLMADFVIEYNNLKEEKRAKMGYITGLLDSYLVLDENFEQQLLKEVKNLTRLNDKIYLLDKILDK